MGKKKKKSGRKEVTTKDLLLLKISLYLKSPSVSSCAAHPVGLWLKACLGILGSSIGISQEGTLPSADTHNKSCTEIVSPRSAQYRAWLSIPPQLTASFTSLS